MHRAEAKLMIGFGCLVGVGWIKDSKILTARLKIDIEIFLWFRKGYHFLKFFPKLGNLVQRI